MAPVQSTTYLTSKLGNVDPATRSKAVEIIKAANAAGHLIHFVWGMGGPPEHSTGRALDIMVFDKAAGLWVRNYVWANRARLRLKHVIWDQEITSTVSSPGVRRPMADRGSPTENHEDHNHILFLEGAYVAPGAASKPATTAPASSVPNLPRTPTAPRFPLPSGWYFGPRSGPRESVSGYFGHRASLMAWQRQMRRRGWTISVDGYFGPQTERVVRAFQDDKNLGVDGKIGPKTWAAAWTAKVTR